MIQPGQSRHAQPARHAAAIVAAVTGAGRPAGPVSGGADVSHIPAPEADRLGWQYSTALKIDACGLTDAEVWVFEVRPEATVSALGSAVCYTMVAQRDAVFDRPLVSAIVCESMQPDVAWTCDQLDVRVFYV